MPKKPKDGLFIRGSCLIGERKEMCSELPRGQSYKARHASGEEVRKRSKREACPLELLTKRPGKASVSLRD